MDGFEEKKWFIYVTDHHEGPFSMHELEIKLQQSQISKNQYVWCDGMPDWKMMSEVSAFETLLKPPTPAPPTVPETEAEPPPLGEVVQEATPVLETVPIEAVTAPPDLSQIGAIADVQVPESQPAFLELSKSPPVEVASEVQQAPLSSLTVEESEPAKRGGFLKRLILILILGGAAFAYKQGYLDPILKTPALQTGIGSAYEFAEPYLLQLSEKVPGSGQWISPIRSLPDVAPDEFQELKHAAMSRIDQGGPKAAVALSRADLTQPFFYIVSNLPDGSRFEVSVDGIPETLLNQRSFSQKVVATVSKKLGMTTPLKSDPGKAIPRGHYKIHVVDSSQNKLIAEKSYFLGGAEDSNYKARLTEFHDKLKKKGDDEIGEIRQFLSTIDQELASSVSQFELLTKGKLNASKKRIWNDYQIKWVSLNAQLSETFSKWTPATLMNEYLFGALYQSVRISSEAVNRVHDLQDSFIKGKANSGTFKSDLMTAMSAAQLGLTTLKSNLAELEKSPNYLAGLSPKEMVPATDPSTQPSPAASASVAPAQVEASPTSANAPPAMPPSAPPVPKTPGANI